MQWMKTRAHKIQDSPSLHPHRHKYQTHKLRWLWLLSALCTFVTCCFINQIIVIISFAWNFTFARHRNFNSISLYHSIAITIASGYEVNNIKHTYTHTPTEKNHLQLYSVILRCLGWWCQWRLPWLWLCQWLRLCSNKEHITPKTIICNIVEQAN